VTKYAIYVNNQDEVGYIIDFGGGFLMLLRGWKVRDTCNHLEQDQILITTMEKV